MNEREHTRRRQKAREEKKRRREGQRRHRIGKLGGAFGHPIWKRNLMNRKREVAALHLGQMLYDLGKAFLGKKGEEAA